jgi:uncharacterized protein (UPF0261 family)
MRKGGFMVKTIVVLCSMDSKGEEGRFLKTIIEAEGYNTILLDIGIGQEPTIVPDIPAEAVAKAGGGDIREIRASRDTGAVIPIMIKGASMLVLEMFKKGELGGIVSFGGTSNTTTATTIMKTLPFGIPKFMASSSASMPAYAGSYMGTKDITMMHTVVDISGLNALTRSVLERVAGGICGMAKMSRGAVEPISDSPLIALTSVKFSEECSQNVRDLLEEKGYVVIPFHAQGMGDRAMEELIAQGLFDGVVDIVPAGVAEEFIGGNKAAGPERLESAGRRGIPQVITPCALDMISCGPLSRKDRDDPLWKKHNLAERKMFVPDEFRVLVRTTADELKTFAALLAEKLNRANGPVKFFIPTRGWSSIDVKGAPLYEPETDAVFAPELQRHLNSDVEVIEVDTEYNSADFARALVDALEHLLKN